MNTGESQLQIHVPATVYAGEATDGRCVTNEKDFLINGERVIHNVTIMLVSDAGCTINQSRKIDTIGKHYQKNFTVTCSNVSASHITCYTNGLYHDMEVTQLEGT